MSGDLYKITDLIKHGHDVSFSFEITPNMLHQLDQIEIKECEPLFYSITWHSTLHQCINLDVAPLKLAKYLKRNKKNVLLHLSCHLLTKSYADDLLLMLQREGICNLFVILGEKYVAELSDFKTTKDLILYIRQKTGNYFCIGVAAFPEKEDKLKHLKEKIDSGADFIITQAVFNLDLFVNFINKCKSLNITVPILPGIFPFETEKELTGFVNLCKVHVTDDLMKHIKSRSGIDIVSKQIMDLSLACKIKHFHFFTLDKIERSFKVVKVILANKY